MLGPIDIGFQSHGLLNMFEFYFDFIWRISIQLEELWMNSCSEKTWSGSQMGIKGFRIDLKLHLKPAKQKTIHTSVFNESWQTLHPTLKPDLSVILSKYQNFFIGGKKILYPKHQTKNGWMLTRHYHINK